MKKGIELLLTLCYKLRMMYYGRGTKAYELWTI